MGWSGEAEYQRLKSQINVLDDSDFQRFALHLLRVLWPNAVEAPKMRSVDRAGIDLLVWSDDPPFPLAVQCKGYRVTEARIGDAQTRQCLTSIASFRASGVAVNTYLLVHNRDGRNVQFRTDVERDLATLVQSGQAQRAELWDCQRLLNAVFEGMRQHIHGLILQHNTSVADRYQTLMYYSDPPLEVVPYTIRHIATDQFQLQTISVAEERVADISQELLNSTQSRLSVLIGEFGLGKTTAALRSLADTGHHVLYALGAQIGAATQGKTELLRQCLDHTAMLRAFPTESWPAIQGLVTPVLERFLANPQTPAVLIIDGLDEAAFLSRTGSLQNLFNCLLDIRIPIILTARTEFWNTRLSDFQSSFGILNYAGRNAHKHQKIRLIELEKWTDPQIDRLIRRRQAAQEGEPQKLRLGDLARLVAEGRYQEIYGDIPRRPLFLRCIIESVAEYGIQRTGRARLFGQWAALKIRRDVVEPIAAGGAGRAPLTSEYETTDSVIELAYLAMELAAINMTMPQDEALALLSSCPLEIVLSADVRLEKMINPAGLPLLSLLMPTGEQAPGAPVRVRFAHRAYQEFFLARHLLKHPEKAQGLALPPGVQQWMDDLIADQPNIISECDLNSERPPSTP